MLIKLLNVSFVPYDKIAVPEHTSCSICKPLVRVVTKLKRIQGIEDNYEQIRENYPSLIEETQLQVYENVLPESTILRIGQKFVYGETFIHTELRSIALFFIMAMSFNF